MKGKKTDNETIYKVMLSYIVTRNYSETARTLDMPESTVRRIVEDNKDKEEFAKLCDEKRNEFVEKADKIIFKATELLERRIDTALEQQYELDMLIDTVIDADDDDISRQEKASIAKKLSKLQVNSLSEIATSLGILYDKRALAKGESTANVGVVSKQKNAIADITAQMQTISDDDV